MSSQDQEALEEAFRDRDGYGERAPHAYIECNRMLNSFADSADEDAPRSW